MDIGDRIKQLRIAKGITQDDLAKKIKTNRQNICRYENNVLKDIPMSRIVAIAEALDTTPAFLLGYMEEESAARQRVHRAIDQLPDEQLGIISLLLEMSPQQIEALAVLASLSRNNPKL